MGSGVIMSESTEVSEEHIFHVLKKGAADSKGPFSKEQLEEMLSDGKILPEDYVFFEGLKDWMLISEAFEFRKGPTDFAEDGQDLDVVKTAFAVIDENSEHDEEIVYIAVQQLDPGDRVSEILQATPEAVVLTNLRLAIVDPKLIGDVEVKEFPLNKIDSLTSRINRRHGGQILTVERKSGDPVSVESIPDHQLFRLIELAEEIFENRKAD